MVKERIESGKVVFICGDCSLSYRERELAQKCEDFCIKNKCCSVEITKEATKESKKRLVCS